jgi:methyltransferase (TIGR00027 family)
VLIEDSWGDRLILEEERQAMLARAGGGDADALLRAHPSYGTVIMRARYAEDLLAGAVRRGVRQYVIIGAGMDSFALRRPRSPRDLEIFEVDHPNTQELKAGRLELCGIPLPAGLQFVAADLGETGLGEALAGSSYRSDRPAFFSWLGVTTYLTPEANLATLAAIATHALPGSELVFSYLDQSLLDADVAPERLQRARAQVASLGEPWISGFDPGELGSVVRGAGLEIVENLGPEDLAARYCAGRADGLSPSLGAHLAHARVVA